MRLLKWIFPLLLIVGFASRYDDGVMRATIKARIEMGQLSDHQVAQYDGYVAVEDCGQIGQPLWVLINDGRHYLSGELVDDGRWQKVLITDCARRDDGDGAKSWMAENGILIEMDYNLAAKYGFTHLGALPVVISDTPPQLVAH